MPVPGRGVQGGFAAVVVSSMPNIVLAAPLPAVLSEHLTAAEMGFE